MRFLAEVGIGLVGAAAGLLLAAAIAFIGVILTMQAMTGGCVWILGIGGFLGCAPN